MTVEMIDISYPENLRTLHVGEEALRIKSIEAITRSPKYCLHLRLIESVMDLLNFFVRKHQSAGPEELTIQLLGIRIFNSCASSLKLMMSGYYQAATLQLRDLLETIFLVDFFRGDPRLISEWNASDDRARERRFSPKKVRNALDRRYGHTEGRRAAKYRLL
jgi:hypothetical protein